MSQLLPEIVNDAINHFFAPPVPVRRATQDDLLVRELARGLEEAGFRRLDAVLGRVRESNPSATLVRSNGYDTPQPFLDIGVRSTAQSLGYRAAIDEYHLWLWLELRTPTWFSDFVISFHSLGPLLRGMMTTHAFIAEGNPGHGSHVMKTVPACREPFDFTCYDTVAELQPLFEQWLDAAIIRAFNEFERYRPAPAPFPTETPNA